MEPHYLIMESHIPCNGSRLLARIRVSFVMLSKLSLTLFLYATLVATFWSCIAWLCHFLRCIQELVGMQMAGCDVAVCAGGCFGITSYGMQILLVGRYAIGVWNGGSRLSQII